MVSVSRVSPGASGRRGSAVPQFRASASQLRMWGLCISIKMQTGTVSALPFADLAEHPGHLGLEGQLVTVFQMRASSNTLPCVPETGQRPAHGHPALPNLSVFSIFLQELPRAPLRSLPLTAEETERWVNSKGKGGSWPHLSPLSPEGQIARPVFKPRPRAGVRGPQQQSGPAVWASRSLSSAETSPACAWGLEAVCRQSDLKSEPRLRAGEHAVGEGS